MKDERINNCWHMPFLICVLFYIDTTETTFYGYYLMLAVAIFGYALGWLTLTHYNDIQTLSRSSKILQRPFYIFEYRVSYMLLCIGLVGAINMHALIGPPFIIDAPVIEKTERSGRNPYHSIVVNPTNYPSLELKVNENFWQEISIGQRVLLTAQKNVLGLSVVDDYGHK